MAPMPRFDPSRAARLCRQVDSWLPLAVSPRERSLGHRKAASDPTGQQPARAYSYNLQAIS